MLSLNSNKISGNNYLPALFKVLRYNKFSLIDLVYSYRLTKSSNLILYSLFALINKNDALNNDSILCNLICSKI